MNVKQENEDVKKVILHVERIIENLNKYWHSIELLLSHVSKPLTVDDRGLAHVLKCLRDDLERFKIGMQSLDISQTFAEIKFIGKRLHEIECHIREMKQDGIKKKIHLDLTMNGYEMVKKRTDSFMESFNKDESNYQNDQEIIISDLLKKLPDRDQFVVIHRVGLFGEKPKTYVQIEEKYKINREKASKIFKSAIIKLRHSSRRNLVKKLTHKELKDLILGE